MSHRGPFIPSDFNLSWPWRLSVLSKVSLVALVIALGGCGVSGSYVWVHDAPDEFFKVPNETFLSLGDVISIKVFGQESLSAREKVRRDGLVTLPLIGEIHVATRLPSDVAREIETRLKPFVNDPHVTVVVEESHTRVVVLGELAHSGLIELDGSQGMYEALALAGGISQYASETRIFVMRSTPKGTYRVRFNYGEITRQEGKAAAFRLQNGDKIFVE